MDGHESAVDAAKGAPEQYDAHIRARADALRTAFPAEPPKQALEAIAMALCSDPADECRAVYRALRAHLLGEA